ncbi:MAG: ThiF family adenylyltransferase, partial [Lachnospiraceae bacterium]|nr:ThiF family adenylyltransferase [Lachnospiraceae bacterium]
KERVEDISPECTVRTFRTFYLPDTQDQFDFSEYDYVVDAIDTVTGKLTIIENAKKAGVPVISSMGAGNKIDPTAFEVADLYETSVCPLAKVMRRECKKRGIDSLKVVYSKEVPRQPRGGAAEDGGQQDNPAPEEGSQHAAKRVTPGSTAFVPSVAGLIIAGEIINDLSAINR